MHDECRVLAYYLPLNTYYLLLTTYYLLLTTYYLLPGEAANARRVPRARLLLTTYYLLLTTYYLLLTTYYQAKRRMRDECRVLAELAHPHLIRMVEVCP
jgi:hypothetical protein